MLIRAWSTSSASIENLSDSHLPSNSIGVYIASCSVFQLAVVPDVGIKSLGTALSGLKIIITKRFLKFYNMIFTYDYFYVIQNIRLYCKLVWYSPAVEFDRSIHSIVLCFPIGSSARCRNKFSRYRFVRPENKNYEVTSQIMSCYFCIYSFIWLRSFATSFHTHLASNSIGVNIASCSVFQLAVLPDGGIKGLTGGAKLLQNRIKMMKTKV